MERSRKGTEARDRVLFISHEATRTGAPIMLLHLLRWLKDFTDLEIEVVCVRGGPLVAEFEQIGPVTVLEKSWTGVAMTLDAIFGLGGRLPPRPLFRVVMRVTSSIRRSLMRRRLPRVDRFILIYANSAVSAMMFDSLPRRCPPVLTHVHELQYALRHMIPKRAIHEMLQRTDRFIACSRSVQDNLVDDLGVPKDRVEVCYEPIDARALTPIRDRYSREEILHELDVPDDALIVGASGSREWRKGMDLFGLVAASVRARMPSEPIYFVWVGGPPRNSTDSPFRHDFNKLGIEGSVRLIDSTSDPYRYFSIFDVSILTSREDPFPLVSLEALAMATPVVAFDSGGIREMLAGDCGVLVRYADTSAMADAVVDLLRDPVRRKELGARGAEVVAGRYDITTVAPQIFSVMRSTLRKPSKASSRRSR